MALGSEPVMSSLTASATHAVTEAVAEIKPRLRGWLHAGTVPFAVLGCLMLVVLAPTLRMRVGMAALAVTASMLFSTSALYHRMRLSPRWELIFRRADHANIYLVIAGTCTAFALSLLPADSARTFLLVVWLGALAGVVFKVAAPHAPRWVSTPLYVLLGWVSVFFVRPMYDAGGPVIIALIALGGVLYTAGAVVYGLKRPDPSPTWFGFHEVFHVFTILAFVSHFVAASLVVAAAQNGALAT